MRGNAIVYAVDVPEGGTVEVVMRLPGFGYLGNGSESCGERPRLPPYLTVMGTGVAANALVAELVIRGRLTQRGFSAEESAAASRSGTGAVMATARVLTLPVAELVLRLSHGGVGVARVTGELGWMAPPDWVVT